MSGKIYIEPRACEICKGLIQLGADEIAYIHKNGGISRYHLECHESIITPDLPEADDFTLDFDECVLPSPHSLSESS